MIFPIECPSGSEQAVDAGSAFQATQPPTLTSTLFVLFKAVLPDPQVVSLTLEP
jgi:hypothetical protein